MEPMENSSGKSSSVEANDFFTLSKRQEYASLVWELTATGNLVLAFEALISSIKIKATMCKLPTSPVRKEALRRITQLIDALSELRDDL